MTAAETAARKELARTYREMAEIGLTALTSGNVSLRFEGGLLISPMGASAETISEEGIVRIGADGAWADGLTPSSEWRLHQRVYEASPGADAIVHTHSDHCVAVSCHCRPLPGFHYLVGVFGGDDVPCVPYNTFGSDELAVDVAEALKARSACLMANHGATARGRDLRSALRLAERLEVLCRQYILASILGEPRRLTADDWARFHARIGRSGYQK